MGKSRILMVVNSPLENAGVPNVVMNIVRPLHDEYTFDVLCYSHQKGYYEEAFTRYGGRIFNVDLLGYPKHRIIYPLRELQLRKVMRKILKQNHYCAVHCHNGEESGICLDEARKYGISGRISHAHGQYRCRSNNPVVKYYFKRCMKLLASNATNRIACSKSAGKTLFGNDAYKSILNPLDYETCAKIVRKEHCGIRLVQIGYFHEVKNQLFSLEILAELRKRGYDASIGFVGYRLNEEYSNKILNRINDLKLTEAVSLLPSDTPKNEIFEKADCTLLPSKEEGLSIVALESQAAGISCVLSTGIPEDVDMGLCRYVSLKDKEGWINAVIEQVATQKTPNREKLKQLDVQCWTQEIKKIYDLYCIA